MRLAGPLFTRRMTRASCVLASLLLLSACASFSDDARPLSERAAEDLSQFGGSVAGAVGGLLVLSDLDMLDPAYLSGMLIAYAFYDPLAPNWRVDMKRNGDERVVMDLKMRTLVTGGEGEARQVFLRTARRMVEEGGYASFDVLRYEEGMEATRPFARRVAQGEIRLLRSRQFPTF